MVLEHSNYRSFLKSALADRQKKNPAYSMRAFAGQVGLSQSTLSLVFSGKKNLSIESATRIAEKLGLGETESEYLRVLVQMESTKSPDLKKSLLARAQLLNPNREVRELSLELFQVIADWHHLAIKNLLNIEGFEFTPKNIALRLGISKLEAEVAIDRLQRLEMIEEDPKSKSGYRVSNPYVLIQSKVPNEALRRFHRQMLEKAIESLETQTPQEKLVESETFAFSPKEIPEAKKIVDGFFDQMTALSAQARKKTDVYHLGLQFFNLTKGKK